MATQSVRKVSIEAMVHGGNVRQPEDIQLDLMVESIRQNGWLTQHPPVVHQISEGEGEEEGSFRVLIGNRRTLALLFLKEHAPEEYSKIIPSGKITCVVWKGLTEEEETLIRIDHAPSEDRIPLGEWGLFQAILQLCRIENLTQDQIALKLGLIYTKGKGKGNPNRSYVQVRKNLARLPGYVQDEMRRYTLEPTSTALRWAHIAGLYKVYGIEFAEYPNGDGPLFQAKWLETMTPKEVTKVVGKTLTPSGAENRAKVAASAILKRVLLACVSLGPDSLESLDAILVRLEKDSQTLGKIKASLGDTDFTRLIEEIAQEDSITVDYTAV